MKKALAALLIFTLSVSQVGQSCRGENVNPVAVAQKDQDETKEKETSQQELNEKILARLIELETKINGDPKIKKENIFLRILKAPFKFLISKFFWLVVILFTYTCFLCFLVSVGLSEFKNGIDLFRLFYGVDISLKDATECLKSAAELGFFLYKNPGLTEGILNKLFEEISGNYGDHKLTSEEKKRVKDVLKELMKRFHPDNINRLKNLTKEDLEEIAKKANSALDIFKK